MTIEEIENIVWAPLPDDSSYLIRKCHELRRKDLNSFSIEEFRILISQNEALEILVPLAIDRLNENIFAEGYFYEGDLLKSVLTSEHTFWTKHTDLKQKVIALFKHNSRKLLELEVTEEIKESLFTAFKAFDTA